MGVETIKKELVTIDNLGYSVLISKDGSKYVKFELVEEEGVDVALPRKVNTSDEKFIIIDSVKSGIGRNYQNDLAKNVIIPIFNKLKIEYEYIRSTHPNFIKEFGETFNEKYNSRLVSEYSVCFISGDTSISEFLNELESGKKFGTTERNINILPLGMGTGNALANSLKLKCPVEALRLFLADKLSIHSLPLYKVIFPDDSSIIFFIILSMGFHANLLYKSNDAKYQPMGVERFQLAAKEIMTDYKLNQTISVIDVQDNELKNDYSYFALINVPNLEAHYLPSTKSNIFQSELHLLGHLSSQPRDQLMEKILKGYSNKIGDEIKGGGTIYEPFEDDLTISLPIEKNVSDMDRHKYEICCDGLLYNLLDFKASDNSRINVMKVKFEGALIGKNNIKVFYPEQ